VSPSPPSSRAPGPETQQRQSPETLNAARYLDKFPRMVINGQPEAADWTAVRMTKTTNSRDNNGASDVNSADIRCFGGRTAKAVAAVTAGTELGFVAPTGIMHFGPASFYMARVPDGTDITTWDPTAAVWFKAGSISAVQTGGALTGDERTWPAYRTLTPLSCPTGTCQSGAYARDRQDQGRLHGPQGHARRPVPSARREHRATPGAEPRWRPVLHQLRPGQHHGRRQWHARPARGVPWCLQGQRPRSDMAQLAGEDELHAPRTACLGGLDGWEGVGVVFLVAILAGDDKLR